MKYRCCNDVIAAFSALNGLFWNWLFRNRPASSPRHSWPVRGLRGGAAALVSPAPPMASPPGDSSARGPRGCQRCRGASPQHPAYTPRYIPTRAGPAPLPSLPLRSYPAPAPLLPRCHRRCPARPGPLRAANAPARGGAAMAPTAPPQGGRERPAGLCPHGLLPCCARTLPVCRAALLSGSS